MVSVRFILSLLLLSPALIHGQEITDTIPAGASYLKLSGDFTYETVADTAVTLVINELLALNSDLFFDERGGDDDWFELFNFGDDPVKINGYWFTDNPDDPFKWQLIHDSNLFIEPGEHLLFWADGEPNEGYNHVNFKLSGDGEYLAIRTKDSTLIDEILFGAQTSNTSFGRYPDGGSDWLYLTAPTPGTTNDSIGAPSILPLPQVNLAGGLYNQPIDVTLSMVMQDAEIRYTLDASAPNQNSLLYSNPIPIDSTTILRARIIGEGYIDGPVLTTSYLFNTEGFENPVISVVSDPDKLFGIHGLITTNSTSVEVPANFEFIVHNKAVYSSGMGIQLHSVKTYMPNSMRFYARPRYGNDWFNHPFFGYESPQRFKRLIVRNGGNDNVNRKSTNTHFRDPLAAEIAESVSENVLTSDSRPVNVFLNGEYYGLFNLRERIDEYYIESHTGESKDFDLLERTFGYGKNRNAIYGSFEEWDELMSFVDTTGDLARDADYEYVCSQIDIENFTDYWITEVFLGNYDWLSNNVKFWKGDDGKWQWIFWDLDHGMGLEYSDYGDVTWNTLKWSLTFSDRAWTNGYNNMLIRNLLKNESYKEYFIKRFNHLLNTSFTPDNTLKIYESVRQKYLDDMPEHAVKWENDLESWVEACDTLKAYLEERPEVQREHLQEFFNLEDPVNVTVSVYPPGAGALVLGDDTISTFPFSGEYFPEMEYSISPEAEPGFELYEMSVNNETVEPETFELTDSINITLSFIQEDAILPIQITEVYFNNRSKYDSGDWIELFNYGIDTFDLSGCMLKNDVDEVVYTFDAGVKITPQRFLVIAERINDFQKIFHDSVTCYGNLKSGFSENISVWLTSNSGEIYTRISLKNPAQWITMPDEGHSLEMVSLINDPDRISNWNLSSNKYGSPGIPNDQTYNFHLPVGKDSVFDNAETITIGFVSSGNFYSDPDGHELAEIVVSSLVGPGEITAGISAIENGNTYPASDFQFIPQQPAGIPTVLNYRFIDYAGQESTDYSIEFKNTSGTAEEKSKTALHYPVPASDYLIIELPEQEMNEIHFMLMSPVGRVEREIQTLQSTERLRVDLSEMESGLYFYRIETGTSSYFGKFTIVK